MMLTAMQCAWLTWLGKKDGGIKAILLEATTRRGVGGGRDNSGQRRRAPLGRECGSRGGGGRAREQGVSEGRHRASPWREGEAGGGKQEVAALGCALATHLLLLLAEG